MMKEVAVQVVTLLEVPAVAELWERILHVSTAYTRLVALAWVLAVVQLVVGL